MITTLVAASLAAAQPQPPAPPAPPAPPMDQSKMDHSKMSAEPAKMGCCKDGCACCAKMKDKPAA